MKISYNKLVAALAKQDRKRIEASLRHHLYAARKHSFEQVFNNREYYPYLSAIMAIQVMRDALRVQDGKRIRKQQFSIDVSEAEKYLLTQDDF